MRSRKRTGSRNTRESLKTQAAECLLRFQQNIDVTGLPAPWEHNYHGVPDQAVSLARAHDSLQSLAAGEFQTGMSRTANRWTRATTTSTWRWSRASSGSLKIAVWLVVSSSDARCLRQPPEQSSSNLHAGSRRSRFVPGGGGQAIGLDAAGFQRARYLGAKQVCRHGLSSRTIPLDRFMPRTSRRWTSAVSGSGRPARWRSALPRALEHRVATRAG